MAVVGSLYGLPEAFFLGASEQGATAPEDLPDQQPTPEHEPRSSSGEPATVGPSSSQSQQASTSSWSAAGATCVTCGIGIGTPGFTTPAEQRAHFKTDWHRYNVKRKLSKQPPLNEDQFAAMVENQDDSEMSSISGSSSSDSEDEGGRQQQRKGQSSIPPRALFRGQDGRAFCVWKCLLERDHVKNNALEGPPANHLLTELQKLRTTPGLFVVVLLRGGHFAAAVFRIKAPGPGQGGQGKAAAKAHQPPAASGSPGAGPQPAASTSQAAASADLIEVVNHKTFHRYVVRAKAGGKQSAQDASGKFAKSAGAALRRYGEAALDKDIADLLAAWKDYLSEATRIFVQAPASNAKSVFAENSAGTSLVAAGAASSHALLNPADPRVRRIPFVTQRPTFKETRRVIGLLLSVFEPTAATLAAAQAKVEAAEVAERQKVWQRLERKRSKEAGKAAGVRSGSVEPQEADEPADREVEEDALPQLQETPLHAAARAGDADAVLSLLQEGANPCQRDSRGRTPYAVCANKVARDAFRKHMGTAPDEWDWTAAGVPSALTDELQAAQAAKKAEKRARQKAREKEQKSMSEEARAAAEAQAKAAAKAAVDAEIAQAAAEAAALAAKLGQTGIKGPAGKKVGGPGAGRGGKSGGRGQPPAPPTPEEMAARREQMAAAAEARMKALQQASSQQRLY